MSKCNKFNPDGTYNPFNGCSLSLLGGERLLQLLVRHGKTSIKELQRLGRYQAHQLEFALRNRAERIIRDGDFVELRFDRQN